MALSQEAVCCDHRQNPPTAFRVTQQRGQVLDLETPIGVRRVLATVHPSAVLRATGDDRSTAYAGLVADLRTARTAVA